MARFASFVPAACLLVCGAAGAHAAPRERVGLDQGWAFHLGNDWGLGARFDKAGMAFGPAAVTFGDASWRRVDLPHDWAVELPFDPRADASHGFKAIGPAFPGNSIAWYRRSFELSAADAGKRIWLEFDGVYRDCRVFVNGWNVGHHESGYSSFRYDITDVAHYGGRNVIAVRVDATVPEGWFYEGAGIYRHVWLVKTAPVAVAPDGVFVSSRFPQRVPDGPAELELETALLSNEARPAAVTVAWQVFAPSGAPLAAARESAQAAAMSTTTVRGALSVDHPSLWSPEHPHLYRLATTVERAGVVVDRLVTEFGIRSVGFDVDRGFLLNGHPYPLHGTCNHQDHAGVGTALPDALQYYRVARLKEMGCNAYRTSHNPPTPELLEACDRLGMLVMDENRLLGSDAAALRLWEEQLRRDRNHPAVAIWSIANEEFAVEDTPQGGRVAATLQDIAHRLDPTRPVTYAAPVGDDFSGINGVIQVRGWNYHVGPAMDAYHREHPQQPNVGTEQASTVGTRGIYADDPVRGYVSAYDDKGLDWSNTAERWVTYFADRPWLSGGFAWTGFDYRGEPTPYGWPCINSHFGILDTCGFPKDNYWYYQSCWTGQPVLHLLPHWNWRGREGRTIDVRTFSNCDEVELHLNGRSLGRQRLSRPGQLKWPVPFEPGVLEARGYRGGRLAAETRIETTGAPAGIRLLADRRAVTADGRDLSVITVEAVDDAGRIVPDGDVKVAFALIGPGRIIGVGNGDPSCHEPDTFFSAPAVQTIPVTEWRWHHVADTYAPHLPEAGADFPDGAWPAADVRAEAGPLGLRERAVLRGHFRLPAGALAAQGIELVFGKIEGDATVYLNGEALGPGGDPSAPTVFDVKARLRSGENTIAVALANYGERAGVNRGVELRFAGAPAPVEWSRSTFNGLAQIIVQSRSEPGIITLEASAPGLSAGRVEIGTLAARPPDRTQSAQNM